MALQAILMESARQVMWVGRLGLPGCKVSYNVGLRGNSRTSFMVYHEYAASALLQRLAGRYLLAAAIVSLYRSAMSSFWPGIWSNFFRYNS